MLEVQDWVTLLVCPLMRAFWLPHNMADGIMVCERWGEQSWGEMESMRDSEDRLAFVFLITFLL